MKRNLIALINVSFRKKGLTFTFIILSVFLQSCTKFLEGTAETRIIGTWNAIAIVDDSTGLLSPVIPSGSTRILGGKLADAILFNNNHSFSIFRQTTGPSSVISGIYDIEVLTLNITFAGEPKIKRILSSISETEMVMRDTIGGLPKTITYFKQ